MKRYLSANCYCRRIFGTKVYKLALSAATSCPNRDGTVGYGGCTFCSAGGSGDFATSNNLCVAEQIEQAKHILGSKGDGLKYIAYFQSFTGTYGDLDRLERIYCEAADEPDIVGLSIATRPDCLAPDALAMLRRLSERTTLWVELGLQTIHPITAERINRCYPLSVYEKAVADLAEMNIHRITHVIFGLPGESFDDMLKTVEFVGNRTDGIKLQLLHVLRGTKLAEEYRCGSFDVLSKEEYLTLVADAVEILPESVVIHRLTGDGAKRDLIAPIWSADKKRVLADLNAVFRGRGILPFEK